ncbi:NUDIX hydrolase [Pseudothauera rhizosphaerae]|uniref:NUDIX domain-containing protein n=1 Tax=Pseudothauera rhizosphaerae TaxID=2565932 RepID=A0A4S4AM42_9RHOO|nr:NUDIX domain-containing protein [Pseudothauera rhizosphaerae]THF60628.1 NUDIX domain-containing protein [Pseudothauera rhizosphaerae]
MTGQPHPGIPVGVHVVVERDGRVLMMRRAGTGFFDGLYSLPGGHVEAGESIARTAAREIGEETGLLLREADVVPLGVVHRLSDTNRIDFFVRARAWAGEPRICEPLKCDRLEWFAPDALPETTVPYVRRALAEGSGPWLLELGW